MIDDVVQFEWFAVSAVRALVWKLVFGLLPYLLPCAC